MSPPSGLNPDLVVSKKDAERPTGRKSSLRGVRRIGRAEQRGLFGEEWRLSPAPKPETRRRLKRRWGSCAPRIAKGNALGSRTLGVTGRRGLARGGRVGVAHATGNCALVLNLPFSRGGDRAVPTCSFSRPGPPELCLQLCHGWVERSVLEGRL